MATRRARPQPGLADMSGAAPHYLGHRDMSGAAPHYLGHRERLRQRLFDAGAENLPDYEILEMLLTASNPRGDTKPLAKALIDHFGGLAAVLSADREALQSVRAEGRGL